MAICIFQDSIIINGACCSSPHTAHCSLLGNYKNFQSGQTSGVFNREMITSLLLRRGDLCGLGKDHGYLLLPQEPLVCTFGLWVFWEY